VCCAGTFQATYVIVSDPPPPPLGADGKPKVNPSTTRRAKKVRRQVTLRQYLTMHSFVFAMHEEHDPAIPETVFLDEVKPEWEKYPCKVCLLALKCWP
jgi:hypothetical protein